MMARTFWDKAKHALLLVGMGLVLGLLLPLLCLLLASFWQPWPWLVASALLALAVAQLGYDTLLRGLLAWVARLQGPQIQVPPPGPPA